MIKLNTLLSVLRQCYVKVYIVKFRTLHLLCTYTDEFCSFALRTFSTNSQALCIRDALSKCTKTIDHITRRWSQATFNSNQSFWKLDHFTTQITHKRHVNKLERRFILFFSFLFFFPFSLPHFLFSSFVIVRVRTSCSKNSRELKGRIAD